MLALGGHRFPDRSLQALKCAPRSSAQLHACLPLAMLNGNARGQSHQFAVAGHAAISSQCFPCRPCGAFISVPAATQRNHRGEVVLGCEGSGASPKRLPGLHIAVRKASRGGGWQSGMIDHCHASLICSTCSTSSGAAVAQVVHRTAPPPPIFLGGGVVVRSPNMGIRGGAKSVVHMVCHLDVFPGFAPFVLSLDNPQAAGVQPHLEHGRDAVLLSFD